jgi:hypothetical protein
MDLEAILTQMERNEGHFPQTALEEAATCREEIIPRLLGVLEDVEKDPQPYATDQKRMIHIYAMYLLAQFREPRAYPLLVKIFSAAGDLPFELAGDVVTQDLSSIMASVSDGDPRGMMALVEYEQANDWVRGAALDGLVTLVASGLQPRGEIMAYFARLFHSLDRKPSAVWDGLASACADLCPVEVVEDIRQAYEEGLVDPWCIRWKEIPEAVKKGKEACLEEVRHHRKLITTVVDHMKWWACFDRDKDKGIEQGEESEDGRYFLSDDMNSFFPPLGQGLDIPEPFHRTEPKVGRNEPCPCGSGKKYKRCCGR